MLTILRLPLAVRVFLTTGLVALGYGVGVPHAHACSCSQAAEVIWPAPDSASADRDLAIVVQLVGLSAAEVTVRLTTAEGRDLVLELERVLPAFRTCGGEVVFLHPLEVLSANTTYRSPLLRQGR